jgi:hypothetical protein
MRKSRATPAAITPGVTRTHLTCAACWHEWGTHDPIGTRHCAATIADGLRRNCVCVEEVSLFGR